MKKFLLGVVTGVALLSFLVAAYFLSGSAPVATDAPPMPMEKYLAKKALHAVLDREMPKIVEGEHLDEALAAEVALAIETETSADPEWAQVARGPEAFDGESGEHEEGADYQVADDDVEEVQEPGEQMPRETEKK